MHKISKEEVLLKRGTLGNRGRLVAGLIETISAVLEKLPIVLVFSGKKAGQEH